MFIYIPDGLRAGAPLVVALHGCGQTAADYGEKAGWLRFADRWQFALLLPQQQEANNPKRCFNWFQPQDNTRDQGEAQAIREMIEKIGRLQALESSRIYITGLSAGGAMTAAMLADYPELFSGGAIIAGIPYGCATDVNSAFQCMVQGQDLSPCRWGDKVRDAANDTKPARWPKVSIWQGSEDTIVNPSNARELVEQWTDVHGIDQQPDNKQKAHKDYQHQVYKDAEGNAQVELYLIAGMQHGTPINSGAGAGKPHCSSPGDYFLDVGICSSYYIGKFWGLTN